MTTTADRTKYRCEVVRAERSHSVFGVPGRMHNLVRHMEDEPNQRIRNQEWISKARVIPGTDGDRLTVKIRHDDELLNGHPSFSVTGDIRDKRGRDAGGGCCHDLIAEVFPELAPLIKWHLCSTDGPMHYVANTVYLAGDRDHRGLRKGEESTCERLMNHYVRFGDSPILHKVGKRLKSFIEQTILEEGEFILDKVEHPKEPNMYGPKYQFAGMECRWHECPFDTEDECRQWIDAVSTCVMHWTSRTNHFGEGKARELDAARRVAIWPDATDDQLSAPPHVLEALLLDRLPRLLAEFRSVVESIGFEYE